MDDRELTQLIRGALAPWDRDPSRDALTSYIEALRELDDHRLRLAVSRVRTTRLREHRQPSPADFLAAAYTARREDDRKRRDEPAAPEVVGSLARIAAETAFVERWRPKTLTERRAAGVFSDLLHQAHGVPRGRVGERVMRPALDAAALRALTDLGGVEALCALESHEVLMARERFVRLYVEAGGGA